MYGYFLNDARVMSFIITFNPANANCFVASIWQPY